jgi:hypothetical protein
LAQGEAFLYAATLMLGEHIGEDDDAINLSGVAAATAVLAGIAAADAATCHRLGIRSRGQDHRQAVDLVKSVVPHGDLLAKDLDRLLDVKDSAQYGVIGVSEADARRTVEWARRMVANAKAVLVT